MSVRQTQTMPGMRHLRARYIARARFLAQDETFNRLLGSARDEWNAAYPECRIVGSESPGIPKPTGGQWQYQPPNIDSKSSRAWQFFAMNYEDSDLEPRVMCQLRGTRIWSPQVPRWFPSIDFPIPPYSYSVHPAAIFVSASLLKAPKYFSLEDIERMFPEHDYRLSVTFGYNYPTPQAYHAERVATLDYLFAAIRELAPDDAGRIIDEAKAAGRSAHHQVLTEFNENNDAEDVRRATTPMIKLFPGISGQDLRDAIPMITLAMDMEYRDLTLHDRISTLLDAGKSYESIANQLGINRQTVSNAARRREAR